ncbi:MAG TPA: flagellar biosynthetic protein FliR [Pseudobacteroides sp.]|uniref:flagellar biosynthetic protein FliR n=1 Tax=Pseudobacteroides sp. TaxID=1968840 RepID=UPI002F927802
MQIPEGILLNGIGMFILVFVRMTGLFVIAPIFGRRNIPVYLKVGLALITALLLMNAVKMNPVDYGNNIYSYTMLIFKEFIVGIILGYIANVIFDAILMAGQLIDMQVGFGMVNVLDPISNIQIPISSNFYYMISMMVLMASNGHHVIMKGLFESYRFIPAGEVAFNTILLNDVLASFSKMFLIGFKISAPIIAAILVTDIALGIISKSIPQLNVFIVGMPAKIILGVLVMVLTIPAFIYLVGFMVGELDNEMFKVIKDMVLKK